MLTKGYGIALGYIDEQRHVVSNPAPFTSVNGRGLFILVQTDDVPSRAEIQAAVDSVAATNAVPSKKKLAK